MADPLNSQDASLSELMMCVSCHRSGLALQGKTGSLCARNLGGEQYKW